MLFALGLITFLASVGLALYTGIRLDLPEAVLGSTPLFIMSGGWVWAGKGVQRKRKKAEEEVADYARSLDRIIAKL